ncbi:hypothetical protein IJ843_01220 [bacterium]|nr:hypothetical protein [bacterium]
MFNNSNFSISEKFFIKSIADLFLLISVFAIFAILKIYQANTQHTFTVLLCTFAVVFVIQLFTGLWLGKTLNQTVQNNSDTFKKNQTEIKDLLKKQRETFNRYIETTKDFYEKSEEIKKAAVNTKQLAEQLDEQLVSSTDYTNNEKNLIKDNEIKLSALKDRIQIISDFVLELTEYNQQIVSNVGIVENIAEQTNMLALNATVEAARAGEHGKGFAVVASEIRKLADETKIATTKISSLINDVQNVTHSTIMATEEGSKEIETAAKNASAANSNFASILDVVKSIANNAQSITTDAQKAFSSEINKSVLKLNDEIKESLNEINNTLEKMKKSEEKDI